jgi:hypothetical protein
MTAQWRGAHPPRPDEVHDVELEAVGELHWGETVHLADGEPPLEGEHLLVGLVEDIDGDMVTLRVADSVVLVDISGEPPLGVVGRQVSVRPRGLAVWPTRI